MVPEKTGRCQLWLFGIFSSGPPGDDMVNGFREIDARFPAQELPTEVHSRIQA
jgi:hypothetical protein